MNENVALKSSKGKAKRRQEPRKSIYDQQREVAIIRNARKRGYLRRMTIEVFNECTGLNDRDLPTLSYLNMTSSQLSSVGVLAKCVNLRICILPGNYITNFEPLINCIHLTVLDLHSNQIKNIPANHFWAALNKLQIVYLHDNSLSSLQTIHFLSSSTSIIALTLYDTPLSLKKNYRHHLVNGLWSLKALDGYVISDEEIIEDISTCEMFAAKNDNLKIYMEHRLTKANILKSLGQDCSIKRATLHFEDIITRINKVQAKYCPVVIIQKVARGYLARKYYKHILKMREWAATTIQRCFRYHRGLSRAQSNPLPPPSTPFLSGQTGQTSYAELEQEKSMVTHEECESVGSLENNDISQNVSQISIPGRNASSLPGQISKITNLSGTSNLSKIHENSFIEEMLSRAYTRSSVIEKTISTDQEKEMSDKSLLHYEDLSSLANSKLSSLLSNNNNNWKTDKKELSMLEVDKWDKIMIEEKSKDEKKGWSLKKKKREKTAKKVEKGVVFKTESATDEELFLCKPRLKPEMIGKYQTVRVFLGSVLEKAMEIDEEKAGGMLLSGELPPKQKNDPLVEMHLSKKEMAEDTRRCLRETKYRLQKHVKKVIEKQDKNTTEKQLFLRTHATMSLSCLSAVHQAYRDRRKAQELADKAAVVAENKERRDEVTNRLQTLRQDYHEHVFTSRIKDGVNIADALKHNETKQEKLQKMVTARRLEKTSKEEQHKADMKFVKHFTTQQSCVSKALRCHDQAEFNRENLEKLTHMVHRIRETNLKQKALVRRYLEHSQLVKQAETAQTKAKLEKFLAAKVEERNTEAQERVVQSKKEITKHFYPLCPLNVPISNMSLAVALPVQETTNESSALQTFSSFTETSTSNDQMFL